MSLFIIQCLTLSLSLGIIYIVLKWYKFGFIKRMMPQVSDSEDEQNPSLAMFYHRHNIIRFLLLADMIAFDVFVYFFFDYNGALYLAIMLLLCMPFLYTKKG